MHTHAHTDPSELVPLDVHRRHVLSGISAGEPVTVPLADAHGTVLAEDVVAFEDVPGFANSAVDGYAVCLDQFREGASLEVIGEIPAGSDVSLQIRPGAAIRIMTGGVVPTGADAVVPVELVHESPGEDSIVCHITPAPGENIRPAGESVHSGDVVLRAGRLLDAAAVGMLAAVGQARACVHPAPRVAVMSTGDELAALEAPLRPGQIRDSNSWAIAAAVREAGAVPVRLAGIADDRKALREAIRRALVDVDALVTTGGVSAGRYDFVKEILAELGDVAFQKVAMKPGMPQAFGHVGGVPCFGLPGNPVSALVSFEVFVRPAIRRLQGRADTSRPTVMAEMVESLRSAEHKTEFVRVTLARDGSMWRARSTGAQGSGIFRSMVEADGLAEIPPDVTEVAAGTAVTVHRLREP